MPKLDLLNSPAGATLEYHRDERVEIDDSGTVFPQVTGSITHPETIGGNVLADFSWQEAGRRTSPAASIVELRPAKMGGAYTHITPTACLFHRARIIRRGWRFIACHYVPKGLVEFSKFLSEVTPAEGLSAFWTHYYGRD